MSTQIENDPDKPEVTPIARSHGYAWEPTTPKQAGENIALMLDGSKVYTLTTYTNTKITTQYHFKLPDGSVQRLGFIMDQEGKLLKLEFQPVF